MKIVRSEACDDSVGLIHNRDGHQYQFDRLANEAGSAFRQRTQTVGFRGLGSGFHMNVINVGLRLGMEKTNGYQNGNRPDLSQRLFNRMHHCFAPDQFRWVSNDDADARRMPAGENALGTDSQQQLPLR
jgi:hypothetical protein